MWKFYHIICSVYGEVELCDEAIQRPVSAMKALFCTELVIMDSGSRTFLTELEIWRKFVSGMTWLGLSRSR